MTTAAQEPSFADRSHAASREIVATLQLSADGQRFIASCGAAGWAAMVSVRADWSRPGTNDLRVVLSAVQGGASHEVNVSPSTFAFLAGEMCNETRRTAWSMQVK